LTRSLSSVCAGWYAAAGPAIFHHDDKEVVDSPMDELLKDADVIHRCMDDASEPVKEKEASRYKMVSQEFGLE